MDRFGLVMLLGLLGIFIFVVWAAYHDSQLPDNQRVKRWTEKEIVTLIDQRIAAKAEKP